MKQSLLCRAPLAALIVAVVLLTGLLPRAAPVRAAPLPRLVLHANGSAQPITVVDRNQFLVDALGFRSGETVKIETSFPLYDGGTNLRDRSVSANGNGNLFGVAIVAPAGAKAGWATVTAAGQASGKQAQGRVWVAYRPSINLNANAITAGSSVRVNGYGFVANAQVRVQITIRGTGGNAQTLTMTATAGNNGTFTQWITIPDYTSAGRFTIMAVDTVGGFKRYASLNVSRRPAAAPTATPSPTPTPKPSAHVTASVVPSETLPNQDVTFTGTGFPANQSVTVSVTVDMRGGGNRYISKSAVTDSNGTFTTAFRVPYKAAPGTYSVSASASGVQASDQLQVLPRSAHPANLGFRWISLWYHTVRQGTWDYLAVQSTLSTRLGIWVHVIFPNGQHWDFYKVTNGSGRWAVRFTIPGKSASRHSNQAYLTFQLWHGHQTMQSFLNFTLV